MKTRKPKTIQFRGASFADALELFKLQSDEFRIERTGYTAKVILPDGSRYLFADTAIRPHLFPIAKKLREEVSEKGVPEVKADAPRYYSFTEANKRRELPRTAYCVDLTSAYVYALKYLDLITPETFGRLCELKKPERLRVVGMLATTKTMIEYQRGTVSEIHQQHSPTRGAFFAACEVVGDLMEATRNAPGHLFYWVDGVFFDRPSPLVEEYFIAEGFPCKVEHVTDLHWSSSRRFMFYQKDGVKKYLSVPGERTPNPAWIAELLDNPTNDEDRQA